MRRIIPFFVIACLFAATARAQIFYEPVQHQYSSGGQLYYYGGMNPDIHRAANAQSQFPWWGRSSGYAFHSGRLDTHREVSTEPTRIYSDETGYWNARFFGYSADDARNEAYFNASRYFRKSDVMRNAVRQADGSIVVPAAPLPQGTIEIRPWTPPVKAPAVDAPRKVPQPILIIPKRLLDQPLWREPLPQAKAQAPGANS